MSILPHTPSISPKVAATVLPSTQGSATTPPQRPSHGDGNVLVPEPTPQYTQTLGIPSPSARTSFTRVDNVTDNIETQPTQPSCVMSQDRDHRSVSEASYPENGNGLEQSPLSLQGLPQQIASTAAITEPGASFPIMTTRVDESASQKAFVQEQEDVPQTPQAFLTFLLVSGKKRTMSFEQDTTIGRVKELIWNAWPSEWKEDRPPAPSFLRIVYLGKMLQDDEILTKLRILPCLPAVPQPTIVHLSIRPHGPREEDGAFKKKRKNNDVLARSPDTDSQAGCCHCIIC
ncbi:hypothetical protein Ac2012v2_007079 [Leucoagaricus gongylophorus]